MWLSVVLLKISTTTVVKVAIHKSINIKFSYNISITQHADQQIEGPQQVLKFPSERQSIVIETGDHIRKVFKNPGKREQRGEHKVVDRP
jgi:hypothetical protein